MVEVDEGFSAEAEVLPMSPQPLRILALRILSRH